MSTNATPVSVTKEAAQESKRSLNREQHEVGLDNIYVMTLPQIVAAVGTNSRVASIVVRARPDDVGEMLQIAMGSQRSTAMILLITVRYELGRSQDNASSISRSIMRLDGPRAAEIKSAVHAASDDASGGIGNQIGVSERDPKLGRLEANLVDRPRDVVTQLMAESDNASDLQRYVHDVAQIMQNYPTEGRALISELARWSDERATRVKLAIVRRLNIVAGDAMYDVQMGELKDGEPYRLAERSVPLLSELMLQPDVAMAMMNMKSRAAGGHKASVNLDRTLHHVMFSGWGDDNRKRVVSEIAKTASVLFRESLLKPDPIDRQGESVRTAEFIATSANIAAEEAAMSRAKLLASILRGVADFLPPAASQVAHAAAIVFDLVDEDRKPTWTREAINALMRRVYESIHPAPTRADELGSATHYENEYAVWAAVPLDTYSTILGH